MIKAHLQVEHQLDANVLHFVLEQLCRIFTAMHSDDERCDHCGILLPMEPEFPYDPLPGKHLEQCPLLYQFAVLLMQPVLHKEPYDPDFRPTAQVITAAFEHQDFQ